MLFSNLLKNLSLAAVLALPFACGGMEPGDDAPELESEDAFSSTSHYILEGEHYDTKNIGTSTGRSCFLAGLGGAIGGAQYSTEQNGAGIYVNNAGDYILYIDPLNTSGSYTNKLRVDARCVHSDAGRTTLKQWNSLIGGGEKVKLGAVKSGRRCFLTNVIVSLAYANTDDGFVHDDDYAKIWHDDSNWYIGGHVDGAAWVEAQCIDVTSDYGSWEWISGAGTNNVHFVDLTNETGSSCLLTGIGGAFIFDDYDDGVRVTKDDNFNQYRLRTQNAKHGWVNCVK